jgi:hypothetical protein
MAFMNPSMTEEISAWLRLPSASLSPSADHFLAAD